MMIRGKNFEKQMWVNIFIGKCTLRNRSTPIWSIVLTKIHKYNNKLRIKENQPPFLDHFPQIPEPPQASGSCGIVSSARWLEMEGIVGNHTWGQPGIATKAHTYRIWGPWAIVAQTIHIFYVNLEPTKTVGTIWQKVKGFINVFVYLCNPFIKFKKIIISGRIHVLTMPALQPKVESNC